jgi:hypothetical protein
LSLRLRQMYKIFVFIEEFWEAGPPTACLWRTCPKG